MTSTLVKNDNFENFCVQIKNNEPEHIQKALILFGPKKTNDELIKNIQDSLLIPMTTIDIDKITKQSEFIKHNFTKVTFIELANDELLNWGIFKELVNKTFLIVSTEKWNQDFHDGAVKRRSVIINTI